MKKTILFTAALAIVAVSVFGAVNIKYTNKDSKSYTLKVKIDGNYKAVTFEASKIGSASIAGNETAAVLVTPCGEVKVKDGASITIQNGCVSLTGVR